MVSRPSVLQGSCASASARRGAAPRITCNVECCSSVIPYHLVLRAAISLVCTTTFALPWARGNVIAPVKRSCGNESHARGFDVIAFWSGPIPLPLRQPRINFLKLHRSPRRWQLMRRDTPNTEFAPHSLTELGHRLINGSAFRRKRTVQKLTN